MRDIPLDRTQMKSGELTHVGSYVRDVPTSLDRLLENALDWEHLPHVHASTFSSISLVSADRSGWRAEVTSPRHERKLTMDLRLNREEKFWTAVTESDGAVLSQVATRAEEIEQRYSRIAVEFFVSGSRTSAERVQSAASFRRLYDRLYAEDERMMVARQQGLDEGRHGRKRWRTVVLSDGKYQVPLACPHMSLPLEGDPDPHGILTCQWHGFRFDVRTGRCVSGNSRGWKGRSA